MTNRAKKINLEPQGYRVRLPCRTEIFPPRRSFNAAAARYCSVCCAVLRRVCVALVAHCLAQNVLKIRGGPHCRPSHSPVSPLPLPHPFPIHIRLYKRGRTTVGPRSSAAPGCRVLRVKEGQISTGPTGFPSRRLKLNNSCRNKRQQIFRLIIIDPNFSSLEVRPSKRSTIKLRTLRENHRTTGPHVKLYQVLVHIYLPHSPGIRMRALVRVRY